MSGENIIAFQGIAGANADLACRQAYPYMNTLPVPSFEDVFEAVEDGRAELGMIPIENSQAGRVAEIHNLLPRTNVNIVGEHFQKIKHNLVGVQGAKIEDIKIVYSHPQALMQSRDFLRKLGVQTVAHSNTAAAAKDVALWADKTKAAISTTLAADLYGLEVLKENTQDTDKNTSIFLSISRQPKDIIEDNDAKILTSILFSVRNIPAALYKALGGLATNGVNMIKIESYMPSSSMDSGQFFVTIEGNPADRNVALALEELGFFTKKLRVLGVYKADPARYL